MLFRNMGTASLSMATPSNGTRGKREKNRLIWKKDKRTDYFLAHLQYSRKRLAVRHAKSLFTRAPLTPTQSARALKNRYRMFSNTDLSPLLDVEFSVCVPVINRFFEGQQFHSTKIWDSFLRRDTCHFCARLLDTEYRSLWKL